MQLQGVRRQLTEAIDMFGEAAKLTAANDCDGAYRLSLRARNLVFHATRGLAHARNEEPPTMPVVGGNEGTPTDVEQVLSELQRTLAVADDIADMSEPLTACQKPLARYLGYLRNEVGKIMTAAGKPPAK